MVSYLPNDLQLTERINQKNRKQDELVQIRTRKKLLADKIATSLLEVDAFPIIVTLYLKDRHDIIAWEELKTEIQQRPPWKSYSMERDHNDYGNLVIHAPYDP